ncbi:hypothetical protein L7F22_027418 [Adiantum nelumboides]|nr:hypothetical protein [Adiantum nelumboides]
MALNRAGVQLNPQMSAHVMSPSSKIGELEDSDFAFELSQNYSDEPPPSPKLHNSSNKWQRGMHASQLAEYIHTAAPIFQHFHAMDALHRGNVLDSDTILKCPNRHSYDAPDDISLRISTTEKLVDYMLDAAVILRSSPDQTKKTRTNLRSLMLERKNLAQLPLFVAAYQSTGAPDRQNVDQMTVRSCSSSSSSDASSSTSTSAFFSSSSSTSPQHHRRRSRRWSLLKLDFLQPRSKATATKTIDLPHGHAVYRTPDVHHDAAETGDGKVVSPRQSTGSLSSTYSRGRSSVKAQKEMKMGRQKNGGASAPVSPVASPSRAPLSSQLRPGHPSGGAMSPHAQHYQQQRARAEEARRRTFLPYRHSLLMGACLFPPSLT